MSCSYIIDTRNLSVFIFSTGLYTLCLLYSIHYSMYHSSSRRIYEPCSFVFQTPVPLLVFSNASTSLTPLLFLGVDSALCEPALLIYFLFLRSLLIRYLRTLCWNAYERPGCLFDICPPNYVAFLYTIPQNLHTWGTLWGYNLLAFSINLFNFLSRTLWYFLSMASFNLVE